MAAHTPHHHDGENELVHHEESDVNIRGIFVFTVGLFIVAVVVHVAIWGVFVYFEDREARASAVREFPLATGQETLPPMPRLQETPRQDLRELRDADAQRLNGYGWVDRNAGTVHIPIAEAMKLTLERGLPSRPAQAGEQQAGQAGQGAQPAQGQPAQSGQAGGKQAQPAPAPDAQGGHR